MLVTTSGLRDFRLTELDMDNVALGEEHVGERLDTGGGRHMQCSW